VATEAVVLAAGAGARFGGGKLLAPYMAGVLLDGALAAALAAPACSVTLVTGADAGEDLAEQVAARARRGRPEVDTVHYAGGQAGYPLLFGVE
jgi:CTP:molybdopterin cytidylyltransferase MocA